MRTNIIKLLFLWIILIAFPSYGSAYVVGREDVDTRFWSSGLEYSDNYLFTYKNNGTAGLVVNRDLLGDGDNRFALPMTNGLSFYDENIDEIRTGSIYGAGSGVVLFGGVVAAPFIASAATTAYYATSAGIMTVATAANNTYYKAGAAMERFAYNYPKINYVVSEAADAVWNYTVAPLGEAPSGIGSTLGTGAAVIKEYGHPLINREK